MRTADHLTYAVSDFCGNSASCSYSISVTDTVPPMFACPGDTTAICNIAEVAPYADLDEFLAAGGMVSDGCEVDSMSFSLLSE